jgi:hypothetical protein
MGQTYLASARLPLFATCCWPDRNSPHLHAHTRRAVDHLIPILRGGAHSASRPASRPVRPFSSCMCVSVQLGRDLARVSEFVVVVVVGQDCRRRLLCQTRVERALCSTRRGNELSRPFGRCVSDGASKLLTASKREISSIVSLLATVKMSSLRGGGSGGSDADEAAQLAIESLLILPAFLLGLLLLLPNCVSSLSGLAPIVRETSNSAVDDVCVSPSVYPLARPPPPPARGPHLDSRLNLSCQLARPAAAARLRSWRLHKSRRPRHRRVGCCARALSAGRWQARCRVEWSSAVKKNARHRVVCVGVRSLILCRRTGGGAELRGDADEWRTTTGESLVVVRL